MKYKISSEIGSSAFLLPPPRAVEAVAKAGFDAFDFSMFEMAHYDWSTGKATVGDSPLCGPGYAAYAREMGHIARECGIECNQSHAPFPVCAPEIRALLPRAIECTAEAGGKICVIHPDNNLSPEENARMYRELLPLAKSCGVKIATENMWNWDKTADRAAPAACALPENFLSHLRAVDDPFFVACLDIGHAEMMGERTNAPAMIRALGPYCQALHLHDNDRWHDSHLLPYDGKIDYPAVLRALRDISYSGYLTLEADQFLRHSGCDVEEGYRRMAGVAGRLAAELAEMD